MWGRGVLLAGLALVVSGCAIRPLPEDLSGANTLEIVRRVRCEARSAVKERAVAWLTRDEAPQRTKDIGHALRLGHREFRTVAYVELDPASRRYVEVYDGTAIAYEFTFDIEENNNLGGTLDILKPLSGGLLKLDLGAGAELQRQNTRNFILTDTFADLLQKLDNKECPAVLRSTNFVYPITGTIGLAELVGTFIDLNQTGRLTSKEESKVPVLADTLLFQTKLYATADPMVELTPAGRRWQLTQAAVAARADRTDIHRVIIALSLAPDAPKQPAGKKAADRAAPALAPARRDRTSAERRAVGEIERQKQIQFLDNSRILNRSLGLPAF